MQSAGGMARPAWPPGLGTQAQGEPMVMRAAPRHVKMPPVVPRPSPSCGGGRSLSTKPRPHGYPDQTGLSSQGAHFGQNRVLLRAYCGPSADRAETSVNQGDSRLDSPGPEAF